MVERKKQARRDEVVGFSTFIYLLSRVSDLHLLLLDEGISAASKSSTDSDQYDTL